MPTASVMGDKAMHNAPHCHAPIHPPAPAPTPQPHPSPQPAIMTACCPTVKTGGKMASIVTAQTLPCMIPGCVPGGPGLIIKGSMTVMMTNLPSARVNDIVMFASCVGPIPHPPGKITGPGVSTVQVGG